jgi:hypothetical protein
MGKSVTLGSKRNSVKVGDAVDKAVENEAPLKEETVVEEKSNKRQSSKTSVEVKERPATKRRLGGSRPGRDPFWYLKHEGELELVTAAAENADLGIKEIKVFDPSDAQWENGTVANVILELEYVTIKGIQVRESTRDDSGAIFMQTQSRSWEKDGQKQYMNDIVLATPVQAQILSYVESMLESAE